MVVWLVPGGRRRRCHGAEEGGLEPHGKLTTDLARNAPTTPTNTNPEKNTLILYGSPGLAPAPWILLDSTTTEQAATVLERLEAWLAGADPAATEACAHACSHGQADAFEVAACVGTLADRLQTRIEEVNSWS